jgi:hypothetical protein
MHFGFPPSENHSRTTPDGGTSTDRRNVRDSFAVPAEPAHSRLTDIADDHRHLYCIKPRISHRVSRVFGALDKCTPRMASARVSI